MSACLTRKMAKAATQTKRVHFGLMSFLQETPVEQPIRRAIPDDTWCTEVHSRAPFNTMDHTINPIIGMSCLNNTDLSAGKNSFQSIPRQQWWSIQLSSTTVSQMYFLPGIPQRLISCIYIYIYIYIYIAPTYCWQRIINSTAVTHSTLNKNSEHLYNRRDHGSDGDAGSRTPWYLSELRAKVRIQAQAHTDVCPTQTILPVKQQQFHPVRAMIFTVVILTTFS
jgi:hypothetical protein